MNSDGYERQRRVVVTGTGVISSIGSGRHGYLAGLRAGRCGAGPVTSFDVAGFAHGQTCDVRDFDVASTLHAEDLAGYGRVSQLSAAAARMAVSDADLPLEWARASSGMIAVGTTDGEGLDVDDLAGMAVANGLPGMDADVARRMRASRLSLAVARELRLTDVELATLPNVCAAGNHAIGYAFDAVRSGEVSFALCGGADAPCRSTFASFYRLGALAHQVCQPFDLDRGGVVFGEGAAILVLEPLESARARGAAIHAEVVGYEINCDATHRTRPDQDTVAECMRSALRNAGVASHEVDVVFAHGTGTRANDPMESGALHQVFQGTTIPPVTAIKSMIGHTMGAAAAHSCVAAILAFGDGFIPPTINHRVPDPDCPVDCVPNVARSADVRTALVNSLGIGGNNAAVVLRRYVEEQPEGATP